MHENREISCTSWLTDQDRSAKAINRTADVNVQEKSDCAVVPVNQPNKEGQPSAEAGEGRAQTEENIVPSHMRPTQSVPELPVRGHSHFRKPSPARMQQENGQDCKTASQTLRAWWPRRSPDFWWIGLGSFWRHSRSRLRYWSLAASHGCSWSAASKK